jgi:hypothetical protein
MFTASGKPICRPIHTGIFHSPEYLALPESGNSRLLMLFLLIHPHGGTFHLPGLYQTGPDSMRETLKMPHKLFKIAYQEIHDAGVVQSDDRYRLMWMPCALRLVGPPVSPNVVKGYCRSLGQLPPSPLVQQAIPAYWQSLQPYGHHFLEPFENAFESLLEELVEGFRKASESPDHKISNRYRDKDNYPHRNTASSPDTSLGLGGEVVEYLYRYGVAEGWPESSLRKISALAQAYPRVTLEDLHGAEAILQGNSGTKDPASYLFAVARNRLSRSAGSQDDLPRAEGNDSHSFAGFVDGQSVSFDD